MNTANSDVLIILMALCFVMLVITMFREYRIKGDGIYLYYIGFIIGRRIYFKDIEDIEVVETNLKYIMLYKAKFFGRYVKITLKEGLFRTILIDVEKPEEFVRKVMIEKYH